MAILFVGEDLRLLATRAAVLSKVDAEADLSRPEELTARMSERRYDLLVLCHTVPEKDAEAMTQMVHRTWPETRILQIVGERWMEKPLRMGIAALSTPEPTRLVERTRQLFSASVHRM